MQEDNCTGEEGRFTSLSLAVTTAQLHFAREVRNRLLRGKYLHRHKGKFQRKGVGMPKREVTTKTVIFDGPRAQKLKLTMEYAPRKYGVNFPRVGR